MGRTSPIHPRWSHLTGSSPPSACHIRVPVADSRIKEVDMQSHRLFSLLILALALVFPMGGCGANDSGAATETEISASQLSIFAPLP